MRKTGFAQAVVINLLSLSFVCPHRVCVCRRERLRLLFPNSLSESLDRSTVGQLVSESVNPIRQSFANHHEGTQVAKGRGIVHFGQDSGLDLDDLLHPQRGQGVTLLRLHIIIPFRRAQRQK